jgi:hypothetical protein
MGTTPSKQTFDDIVHQLKENNIIVISKHDDKRYKYAVMKKHTMMFVVRQFIKTEKFSLRHPERGIFYFNTVDQALEIVNGLAGPKTPYNITASVWDTENVGEREVRFTFNTYDLPEAARDYDQLKSKLLIHGVGLGQLTPKMQAICYIPQAALDNMRTFVYTELGVKWQDFSKKPLHVTRAA